MIVITRWRHDVSMAPATCLSQVILVVAFLPFASPGEIDGADIGWLAALGIGQIGLGFALLTVGARLIPAAQVGLITLLEVVLGPLWVWLALDERPSTLTLVGGAIVIVAIVIQTRARLCRGFRALRDVADARDDEAPARREEAWRPWDGRRNLLSLSPSPRRLAAAASTASAAVVINEVESDGLAADCVELYNTGAAPADIGGYVLKDNDDEHTFTIPAGDDARGRRLLPRDSTTRRLRPRHGDSARLFAPGAHAWLDSYTWTDARVGDLRPLPRRHRRR